MSTDLDRFALNQALFEQTPLGVLYQDLTGHILAANAAAQAIFGLPGQTIPDDYLQVTLRGAIHEDGAPMLSRELPGRRAIHTGEVVRNVVIGLRPANRPGITWINVSSFPQRSSPGSSPEVVISIIEDVTLRKAVEKRIQQTTRLYATLGQINQTIVRVRGRQELFENICRVAVQDGEFYDAWIGTYDPASGLLSLVATSRPQRFKSINVHKPPFAGGINSLALRSGKVTFSNDIQT